MTKNEYLENLNRTLYFLDADVRQATIGFYAELLADRMEEGLTEEEAVQAMEDAELIASRMRADKGAVQADGSAVLSPCTITCKQKDISSLYVEFIDRPVIIEASPTPELTLSYVENEKSPLVYSELGGHVRLIEKNPLGKQSFRLFDFSFGNALDSLFRGRQLPDPTVRIQVPCDLLFAMDINTTNGKIMLSGLNGMGEIRLKTSNASVSLQQVKCSQLSLHTSNARITLTHVHAMHRLTAKSSNGSIHAEQLYSRGGVELLTSNARISARNSQGEDQLFLQTSNGSVEVNNCVFPAVFIKTSNAHVQGTMPGFQTDYSITSQTSNGFNNLPGDQKGGNRTLSVRTSNGSIRITFDADAAQ